jgi:hypothetical protein
MPVHRHYAQYGVDIVVLTNNEIESIAPKALSDTKYLP